MNENLPKVPVESTKPPETSTQKNGVAFKALIGIFVLVILSEVGYLAYNKFQKPNNSSLSGPSIQTSQEDSLDQDQPTSSNTIDLDQEETTDTTPTTNVNNIDQNVLDTHIKYLKSEKVAFENASISSSVEGKITEIGNTNYNKNGYNFPFMITIQQSGEELIYYFSSAEVVSAKITNRKNPSTKISIQDLSPGDNISLSVTTSLVNNPSGHSRIFIDLLD